MLNPQISNAKTLIQTISFLSIRLADPGAGPSDGSQETASGSMTVEQEFKLDEYDNDDG